MKKIQQFSRKFLSKMGFKNGEKTGISRLEFLCGKIVTKIKDIHFFILIHFGVLKEDKNISFCRLKVFTIFPFFIKSLRSIEKFFFAREMVRFLVLLFTGFEETEAVVPIDILRRVNVHVVVASLEKNLEIKGSHGCVIKADDFLLPVKYDDFDGVLIPGGAGIEAVRNNEKVLNLIQNFYSKDRWLAAICAAPLLLKDSGCLPKKFTAHACAADQLNCIIEKPVVIDGHVITGRGPGAVFPFAFALVQCLAGEKVVKSLKSSMHYE